MTPALHFTRFGKYEIIRKLGRSMADVYLALDPETNRRVVLKIVEDCRDAYTQLIVEAERRGAQIQQQLHALDPRILEVYDFGDQNGCFFVAMEYAEGKSLAELLRTETRIDAVRAARIAAEICSQMQTLHSFQAELDGQKRAVVHGDIKPSNIQIGPQGQVWLLDFGIAKAITATRNLTQHNLGSPAYCSPERLKNAQVDPAADLWAVGVCLYEMVSGTPPYQAQTTRKLENLIQSRRPPRAVPEDCPAAIKAIITKALAADLDRRYPDAKSFEADLRAFLDRKPALAEAERRPAWDANATVEKQKEPGSVPSPTAQILARPSSKARLNHFLAGFNVVAWSLIAGLIVGLLCIFPAAHLYRYRRDSAPLRAGRDYTRAGMTDIENDFNLYKRLRSEYDRFGALSPASKLAGPMHARLLTAANEVIDAWRSNSEPDLSGFDWNKARACLSRALEMNPADREAAGKLALTEGFRSLAADDPGYEDARQAFERAESMLPKSPLPHLGLARIAVYRDHNVGRAVAELHAAEGLGYSLGPREFEEEADAYLYRAEQSFRQWQRSTVPADQRRLLAAMQRDFQRARDLYEPIAGFSNVSGNLDRLERDQSSAERIQTVRDRAMRVAVRKKPRFYRRWR